MKLLPMELESPIWHRIRVELETSLASLREQNDASLNHDETQKIRGRIAEIKTILGWASTPPPIIE